MVSQQAPSAANLNAALGKIIFMATAYKDPDTQLQRYAVQKRLPDKKGEAYTEVRLGEFFAHRLASGQEPMELNRPTLTPTTAKPTMIYVAYGFEWDAQRRPQVDITGKFSMQATAAKNRLIDEDGLVMGDALPKTFGTAGTNMSYAKLDAARTHIRNVRDKGAGSTIYGVFTPNQLHDLRNALANTGNLGAAAFGELTKGFTTEVIRRGDLRGTVAGISLIEAENLYSDSNDDAAGFVFGSEALWKVGGRPPWGDHEHYQRGGGTDVFFMYDEYVWHWPYPSKSWAVRMLADSAPPTG